MKIIGSMEINTVVGCVNRCDYCPQGPFVAAYGKVSDVRKMTLDTFFICMEKIPKNISIHLSGMAEPFLNPGCTEMITHAAEAGYDVEVYTTLVGMPLSAVDAMERASISKVVVHLPSPAHDSRIRVDRSFLMKLQRISDSRIKDIILVSLGRPDPRFEIVVRRPIRVDMPIDRAGNLGGGQGAERVQKRKGNLKCGSCGDRLNHNVLLPNGDVLLCCMDYRMRHVVGNLLESDYEDLFTSEASRRVQEGLLDDTADILCRTCHNSKQTDAWHRIGRQVRRMLGGRGSAHG